MVDGWRWVSWSGTLALSLAITAACSGSDPSTGPSGDGDGDGDGEGPLGGARGNGDGDGDGDGDAGGSVSGDGDGDDPFIPDVMAEDGLWSDPDTWPAGVVPGEGQDVLIPSGTTVTLDTSPPPLGDLLIEGTLVVDDQDVDLTALNVFVTGRFEAGTEAEPFESQLIVTLTDTDVDRSLMGMGSRGLVAMGGEIELVGSFTGPAWTRLNKTADSGATALSVETDVAWNAGDQIAIAPTDYFQFGRTEEAVLTDVTAAQLQMDTPLVNRRFGVLQYVTENGVELQESNQGPNTLIDERAEVANLTRNIVIQGPDDDTWNVDKHGAHMMIGRGGKAFIEAVEFRRMGQAGRLGRYPVHFHRLSYQNDGSLVSPLDPPAGTRKLFVKKSAIHDSIQRCVVLHGTNNVLVEDNICYDITGHAFFFEDAVERRNVLSGNLALHIHEPADADVLLNHERVGYRTGPSGYWITNPDNTIKDNVAADSVAMGFWISLPEASVGASTAVDIHPNHMHPLELSGFVTHSNGGLGMLFDQVQLNEAGDVGPVKYNPTSDGTPSGTWESFVIEGLVSYKHVDQFGAGGAFWNNSILGRYDNFVIADFAGFGFRGSSVDCTIENSTVVGSTLNVPSGTLASSTTVGVATYHSECVIRDNTLVNLPYVDGETSGAYATDDYYFRPVELGLQFNTNNVLINTDPGYRTPSPSVTGTENFALAGAVWDPYDFWMFDTDQPNRTTDEPYYWVFDLPFLTGAQACFDAKPGNNGKLCPGPYFGVSTFDLDGARALHNPVAFERLDNNEIWDVPDGSGLGLGHMRHAALLQGQEYRLDFPGTNAPTSIAFSLDNLRNTSDTAILSVPYAGASAPQTVLGTTHFSETGALDSPSYAAFKSGDPGYASVEGGEFWEPYVEVGSLSALRSSTGPSFYFDSAGSRVWLKFRGGFLTEIPDAAYIGAMDERAVLNPMRVLVDEALR